MSRTFDAIAIGSGLGGLTAAALFARAGHKVLVLERNQSFGGAATVYHHGALAIEASLHEIAILRSSMSATCMRCEARCSKSPS
jgi:all-trans-retinol 13,14-reductase